MSGQDKKKTNWAIVILKIIALIIGTGATIIAAELFVGNILVAVLSADELASPMWNAIYSAVSYIVAILILIFVPGQLKKIGQSSKKNQAAKRDAAPQAATETKSQAVAEAKDQAVATQIAVKTKKQQRGHKILEQLGLSGWPTWADIGLAPIGYIAYMMLSTVLLMGFSALFPWFDAEEAQEIGFSVSIAGGEKLLAFLTLVVVAPIAEEIIFRGWLYDKIKHELAGRTPKWVEITVATLLVSLLFGFIHLQWNVGVNVFGLSIILCLLREITGTTYAGILLHALKNGIAFYLLFVTGI